MFKKALLQTDLTPTQAEILDFLYQNKEAKASTIAKEIKRSRAIVYKELEELANLGIIEKEDKPNQVSIFRANHPTQLEKLMEIRENKLKKDKELLNNYLPDIISSFNLVHNKPGILYYEGKEGIKNALNHIIKNFRVDREIISFVKVFPERYEKIINESLNYFIKKRIKKKIKTRVLAVNSPEGKKLMENDKKSFRKTKLVDNKKIPFDFQGGELFIYRNEVCIITMENNVYFALIIQNKSIAQLLRAFFESEWKLLSDNLSSIT